MKKLIVVPILLFSIAAITQQITGTVKELVNGELKTIPGVNVHWLDSQIGTITGSDGEFVIVHPTGYRYLIFSYVGYQSDTLDATTIKSPVTVQLKAGTNIDEVVVTARQPGTFIDRIDPIMTEQITGAELCKAACCNLSESFETNASVDAYYSNAVTGARQIRLLGLDGTYVQLLTENVPSMRGIATNYGLLYIPGPWMEGISISKGTSSVKNGYESIAGQINVEFQKPATADKFYLNLFASDAGRKEANLTGSWLLNDRVNGLVLAHYSDDVTSGDHNNDGFMDEPLTRQFNLLNRWYGVKDNWRFIGLIRGLSESRHSGQMGYVPGDAHSSDKPYGIDIETRRVDGFAKVGYVFNNELNSSFGSIYSFVLHNQDAKYGLRNYSGKQFTYYMNLMFQSDLFNEKHNLTSGLSLNLENFDESLDGMLSPRFEWVPGLFAEYAFKPSTRWSVLTGLRADYHNLYGLMITPRVHSKFDITPTTHLRLSAGKGSRTPYVLAENNHFLANSRHIVIADDIGQEIAWNYGVNLTQYLFTGENEMILTLEYARTDFVNQVIIDLDSSVDEVRFYNLNGKSYSNNYQAELSWSPLRGLDLKGALRLSDVKYNLADQSLVEKPLVSRHKGLITASYQTPLRKWQFDLTSQFNGRGRIPSTAANPEAYRIAEEFDPFTIMNAQITKFFRIWEVYLGVENLTNFKQMDAVIAGNDPYGEHFDASLVYGPIYGRKIYAGLRFAIGRE